MKYAKWAIPAVLCLTLAGSWAWASGLCCQKNKCCCIHPPEDCPDCSDPCCQRWVKPLYGHCHVQALIDELCNGNCCERIKAAKKLGCRLHADFCCEPEVLSALVRALLCDTCWEVRRTAAWSLAFQNARVPQALVALYLAGQLDPHYMVRDGAREALDVLLVCRRECYKELFKSAGDLAKQLRGKYNPTKGDCIDLDRFNAVCQAQAATVEPIPAPKPKDE